MKALLIHPNDEIVVLDLATVTADMAIHLRTGVTAYVNADDQVDVADYNHVASLLLYPAGEQDSWGNWEPSIGGVVTIVGDDETDVPDWIVAAVRAIAEAVKDQ